MSLQVWLPLTNGTLKQQGLKNISATIGGTVGLTDVGKLGKCATIGTAAGGITLPASAMTSFTECSVAFWINITSWNTDWDTIFQAGLGSTPWNNYIFGILRNQGNYLCFTVSNGSSTSSGSYASSNLTVGQWMHLAFTYGSGKCKIYINGVLDKEYSTSITPNFAGITHIAIGRSTNGSNYQSKCKLNDFRIYDHCLSPMEVKEIAKGLVLHYPLNRQGWGQENLGNTSATYSNRTNGQTISAGGWGGDTGTVTYYHSGGYNNYPYKVYHKTATGSGGIYYKTADDINIKANTTYTMSVYIKASRNFLGDPYSFNINRGSDNYYINFGQAMQFTTEWKRIVRTFTTDANAAGQYGEMSIIYDDTAADYYIYYSGFKIEEGSVATPWCPNSSDALATTMGLNSTTEYDCSGFCNNGTRTGTFTWTSDTPKYNVSQVFSGSQYIVEPNEISTTDSTIALWVKSALSANAHVLDARNSSEIGKQPIYQYTNGSIQTGGNNVYVTTNTGLLVANTWVHIALVQSGNSLLVYKNGVLFQTLSCTNSPIIKPTIGARLNFSNKYTGQLSDFRVYATALSADDVKSLYQNSAYIDSSGNVYGAVH